MITVSIFRDLENRAEEYAIELGVKVRSRALLYLGNLVKSHAEQRGPRDGANYAPPTDYKS